MEFKFEGRTKLITQILMGIGLIALIGGFFYRWIGSPPALVGQPAHQWILLVFHLFGSVVLLCVELCGRGLMVGHHQANI